MERFRRFRESERDLTEAIALRPRDSDAYHKRGYLYHRLLNQPDRALADYSFVSAIELNRDGAANTFNNRGNLYRDVFHDGRRALEDYTRAIEICPRNGLFWKNRGRLLASPLLKKYRKALADYSKAIEVSPTDADAYVKRASLYNKKLKDTRAAVADYSRAVELNRSDAESLVARGKLFMDKSKEYAAAMSDFTRAIEIDGKSALAYEAFYRRAFLCYTYFRDSRRAFEDYSRCIEIGGENDAKVYNNLANICSHMMRDCRRALDFYSKAIELDPTIETCFLNRARLLASEFNKPRRALLDLDAVLKLNPSNAVAMIRRGLLYEENLGDDRLAERDFRAAMKLDEGNPEPLFRLAFLCSKRNKIDESLRYLNIAIGMDPERPKFFLRRALIRRDRLARPERAVEDLTHAISLDSSNYLYHMHRAESFRRIRNKTRLEEDDLDRALQLYSARADASLAGDARRMLKRRTDLLNRDKQITAAISKYDAVIEALERRGAGVGVGTVVDASGLAALLMDRGILHARLGHSSTRDLNTSDVDFAAMQQHFEYATRDLQAAVRLAPRAVDARLALSRFFESLGDLDKAKEQLQAVI